VGQKKKKNPFFELNNQHNDDKQTATSPADTTVGFQLYIIAIY